MNRKIIYYVFFFILVVMIMLFNFENSINDHKSYAEDYNEMMVTSTAHLTNMGIDENEDIENWINDLINNNQSCRLPCFMNIVPGETKFSDARIFFESFIKSFYGPEPGNLGIYKYSAGIEFDEYYFSIYLEYFSDIITYIEIEKDLEFIDYPIQKIISEFGAPSDIYIYTSPQKGMQEYRTQLVLIYEEHNFALKYFDFSSIDGGDVIKSCFNSKPAIYMFDSLDGIEAKDFFDHFLIIKSIESVTDFDTLTFSEFYKDNEFCIEFLVDPWLYKGGN